MLAETVHLPAKVFENNLRRLLDLLSSHDELADRLFWISGA